MTGYWFAVVLFALCIYFMWVGERGEAERQDARALREGRIRQGQGPDTYPPDVKQAIRGYIAENASR